MKGERPLEKYEVLKRVFGHDAFREGQEKLIDELLAGYDVLGVMPTGAGKSICYQLPALMMEGIALVVSPLISLMKDQVMSLKASGVAAAYINSSLTPWQQGEAIRRAANGAYKIIYVAPERLSVPQFVAFAQQANISLVAVDEAHCVSQWGQDFRPSYLKIADFVEQLPKRPPVAAFTATATHQVRQDIVKMLRLVEPYRLTTGYNRPNLRFTSVKPSDRFSFLYSFLRDMGDVSGIIYCNTRRTVEELTDKLKFNDFSAARYHAGLTDQERRQNQDDFQFDRVRIMVATNAFGMGIDKSNVRFVVHYNMPRNLESYYQEAGRAGRDGEPAECLLLYNGQDVITGKWMIEHGDDNPELSPEQQKALKERDYERLKQMTFYATSQSCLRHYILRYFGETDVPETCDNCSVCDGEPFEVRGATVDEPYADIVRAISREERKLRKEARRLARKTAEDGYTSWERALWENLKTLRGLLAAQKHAPAYTVFSDASLHDMVRRHPTNMDEFLDVSGVGEAKQAKYGAVFLAVIRDGTEPNEAMELYEEEQEAPAAAKSRIRANIGSAWTDEEEERLRDEFESEVPLREIAKRHARTSGGIKARLQKMELIE